MTGANVADLALAGQRALDAAIAERSSDEPAVSFVVRVTDGAKPHDGTIVTIRSGRYAQDDLANDPLCPDDADDQRAIIHAAIADYFDGNDLSWDPDDLTDEIVAALAGE